MAEVQFQAMSYTELNKMRGLTRNRGNLPSGFAGSC